MKVTITWQEIHTYTTVVDVAEESAEELKYELDDPEVLALIDQVPAPALDCSEVDRIVIDVELEGEEDDEEEGAEPAEEAGDDQA